MGRKRTNILGLLALVLVSVAPGYAAADPLRDFASCTGRLSAQMEHEWLIQDPAADTTEDYRALMIGLIQAVMEPHEGRDVLNWRIEAKVAHAALLTRATFKDDAWARMRARQMVESCTALLIS